VHAGGEDGEVDHVAAGADRDEAAELKPVLRPTDAVPDTVAEGQLNGGGQFI